VHLLLLTEADLVGFMSGKLGHDLSAIREPQFGADLDRL